MTRLAHHYKRARSQAELVESLWLFRWALERANTELIRSFK